MNGDDIFVDMINSIQYLNMSKSGAIDDAPAATSTHYNGGDSGFNSGADMNTDNIFFYEDSCPSLSSCIDISNNNVDTGVEALPQHDNQQQFSNYDSMTPSTSSGKRSRRDKELTQIKVNVGIDEDLKMILEMDPSLMDEGLEKAVEPSSHIVDGPKILGLPPKM